MPETSLGGAASRPAERATFVGTPCTAARPPVRSRTARAPPVVPAGATPAAAASAGVAAIGESRYETQPKTTHTPGATRPHTNRALSVLPSAGSSAATCLANAPSHYAPRNAVHLSPVRSGPPPCGSSFSRLPSIDRRSLHVHSRRLLLRRGFRSSLALGHSANAHHRHAVDVAAAKRLHLDDGVEQHLLLVPRQLAALYLA